MSQEKNEYGFLNNIDNKVLVCMIILATGLTGFAIVLNVAGRKECTTTKYVYCEPEVHADHHADKPH